MTIPNLFEGNLNDILNKLVTAEGRGEVRVRKELVTHRGFKVQEESFNGNGVFFNKIKIRVIETSEAIGIKNYSRSLYR